MQVIKQSDRNMEYLPGTQGVLYWDELREGVLRIYVCAKNTQKAIEQLNNVCAYLYQKEPDFIGVTASKSNIYMLTAGFDPNHNLAAKLHHQMSSAMPDRLV